MKNHHDSKRSAKVRTRAIDRKTERMLKRLFGTACKGWGGSK